MLIHSILSRLISICFLIFSRTERTEGFFYCLNSLSAGLHHKSNLNFMYLGSEMELGQKKNLLLYISLQIQITVSSKEGDKAVALAKDCNSFVFLSVTKITWKKLLLINVRCGQFFYEESTGLGLKKKTTLIELLDHLVSLFINLFFNTSPTGKNTILLIAVAAVQSKRVMFLTGNLIKLKCISI